MGVLRPHLAARTRRWSGLGARFVLAMVLAIGLASAVVGLVLMERGREALRADILVRHLATADLAAAAATAHVRGVQGDIRELAGRPSVRAMVERSAWDALASELEHWLTLQESRVESVYVLDRDGVGRASGAPDRPAEDGAAAASPEMLQIVLATGQPYLGTPQTAADTRRPIVPYSVPVLDERGAVVAVVRASLSLTALSATLTGVRPGLNARIAVDDLDRRLILAHVDPARILRPSSGKNAATERLYAGERGAMESHTSADEPMLSAFTPVPGTRWGVLVQQPIADAYAPLDAMEREATRLIPLLAALGGALGGALAVWVIRPLGRLRAVADAMADGDLARRAGIGRRDEIGELAGAFDRMADQLQARDARLADALQRLRAVVDGVDDGIVVLDQEGLVASCNPACERLFGCPSAQIVARPLATFVPDLPWPETGQATEPGAVQDTIGRRVDGTSIPLAVALRETRISGGRQFVAVVHDLTARQAAARAAALEQVNQLQREFISIASHELRSPATALLGFSELLADGMDPADPQRPLAARVHEAAVVMSALLEDLLDSSRLEAGHVELRPEPVDVAALLGKLLPPAAASAPRHALAAEVDDAGRWVLADPGKLERVLRNLLDNAIKYSPTGGRVTVAARAGGQGRVEIAVADEGIGIPPEHLERVFDRFHRVDASNTRKVRGTGLGLHIVRQLVELHRGAIRVESRPGQGSTFRVTLPAAAPGPAASAEAPRPAEAAAVHA